MERTVKRAQGRVAAAKSGRPRKAASTAKKTAGAAGRPARGPAKKAGTAKTARAPKPAMPKLTKPPDALVALFGKATEIGRAHV